MKPLYIKITLGAILLVVFCVTYFFIMPARVKADSFQLYANECDGGFENSGNATGTRDVVGTQISKFSESNSAVLREGMQAELHCRKFKGEILESATPKKIVAKFSWAATYPSVKNVEDNDISDISPNISDVTFDTGPAIIPPQDVSSSTETKLEDNISSSVTGGVSGEQAPKDTSMIPEKNEVKLEEVKQEEPKQEEPKQEEPKQEEIRVEESPKVEESTVSILNLLGSFAYAEEVVTITEPIIEIPNTLEIATATNEILIEDKDVSLILETATTAPIETESISSSTIASSTSGSVEPKPYGVVEVLYSIDGASLNKLGYVESDSFDKTEFEIPLTAEMTWKKIEDIQIFIRSVSSLDGVSPIIYVDSVWLDIEYDKAGEEIHPFPSVDRGDIFEGGIPYENYVAFLINRPLVNNSSTTISSLDIIEASSSSAQADIKEDLLYKTELWIKDNTSTSTENWIFVADNNNLIKDTKVFFCYGYVFWIGNKNTLWTFNPKSSAYNSYSIEIDKPTQFQFNDEAGGIKILIISQPNNMFAFEDYIPEIQNDR